MHLPLVQSKKEASWVLCLGSLVFPVRSVLFLPPAWSRRLLRRPSVTRTSLPAVSSLPSSSCRTFFINYRVCFGDNVLLSKNLQWFPGAYPIKLNASPWLPRPLSFTPTAPSWLAFPSAAHTACFNQAALQTLLHMCASPCWKYCAQIPRLPKFGH